MDHHLLRAWIQDSKWTSHMKLAEFDQVICKALPSPSEPVSLIAGVSYGTLGSQNYKF